MMFAPALHDRLLFGQRRDRSPPPSGELASRYERYLSRHGDFVAWGRFGPESFTG
jgi:hypothetical protein